MKVSLRFPEELPKEQNAIRVKCFHPSGSFVEFGKEDVERSIPERFEKMARLYPNRLAVKTRTQTLTYEALNRAANRLAHAILERCGGGNDPVALLLEHDAPMIAAIFAALKAGKIYVPLDASYPRASIEHIFKDSTAATIVTDGKHLSLARELAGGGVQVIDLDAVDASAPAANPGSNIAPESGAYILYTSGSTGQPKGVVQNHRNVLHEIMNYTIAVHICADDRLALVSSPSFADAVRTIYGALLNGAGLYPLNIREEGLAHLAGWLAGQRITIYRSVPAVFRNFAGALNGSESFPDLRAIYCAGDTVTKADIELFKKCFGPDCILINGLGCGETLTFRWYFIGKETRISSTTVPVGYAIEDMELLLLDESGKEADFGEAGEMAVRSPYRFPGYWRKPELTARAFAPDPRGGGEPIFRTGDLGRMSSDGCLEHLGRKDFQIKIRGHRIEAGQIETALLELDAVKEAVVGAWAYDSTDLRLVAYIVPREKPGPTVNALRDFLHEKLPEYMIPSAFVLLDALPLTPNRKVDRRGLPAPSQTRPELENPFVAPRTDTEKTSAAIWAQVLGLEPVGVHDNFFDLGGHSLLATQIIARVREAFQIEVPLRRFFETPTVAGVADVMRRIKDSGAEKPLPKIFRIPR
ncbi:MAG TPA: non-ribosomal peptide synthetase [Candidatus Binatia bacterium]